VFSATTCNETTKERHQRVQRYTGALSAALAEEREKNFAMLADIKAAHSVEMERERERARESIAAALQEERQKSKELLMGAVSEERERGEAAIERAVQRTTEIVQQGMNDLKKAEEAGRRRQLEAVDLFLETARGHLRTLTSDPEGGGQSSVTDPTD
jgi:hypothetical protein